MGKTRRVEPILEDLSNLDLDITEIAYRNSTSESVVRTVARDESIDMRTRTHIVKARKKIRELEEDIDQHLPNLHSNNRNWY